MGNKDLKDYFRFSDEELQHLSAAGDREAEDTLCKRYIPVIRRLSRTMFILGGDMEDLIQEGTFGLISAIRTYDPDSGAAFRTYAGTCIKNRILSAIQSAASSKHSPLNDGISLEDFDFDSFPEAIQRSVEDLVIAKENQKEIFDTISGLLTSYELNVLRFYLEGLSYEEISSVLKKDTKSIDNAVQRVRRKLRDHF